MNIEREVRAVGVVSGKFLNFLVVFRDWKVNTGALGHYTRSAWAGTDLLPVVHLVYI
jgi:hypothetical protein